MEIIENNLAAMADMARANNIKVVLASVMPVCDYHRPQTETQRPPEKIKALNQWIKDDAAKNQFVYLDYYSAMVDDKGFFKAELTYDGLHPNAAGYQIMAPLAEKAIAAGTRQVRCMMHGFNRTTAADFCSACLPPAGLAAAPAAAQAQLRRAPPRWRRPFLPRLYAGAELQVAEAVELRPDRRQPRFLDHRRRRRAGGLQRARARA